MRGDRRREEASMPEGMNRVEERLREVFGFSTFRAGQREIVEAVLAGEDILVVMPTGAGKSLCYQLPALLLPGTTLVISPLISLMKDQVDALRRRGVAATFINSSIPFEAQCERIEALRRGELRILYVAPERFRSQRFLDALTRIEVSRFAVDEAHCISEWGHDFRPDYLKLPEVIRLLGHPPVIALTATATPDVRKDILDHLGIPGARRFVAGFDRPNIELEVHCLRRRAEKDEKLCELLEDGRPAIVYAASRRSVDRLYAFLTARGLETLEYHAGLPEETRRGVQEAFLSGRWARIVATNAFGMGIDRPDIHRVVHYEIPGSLEAYYQEIGRAGRNGEPATASLLFLPGDLRIHHFFIDGGFPSAEVVTQVFEGVRALVSEGRGAGYDLVEALSEQLEVPGGRMAVASSLKILEEGAYLYRRGPAFLKLLAPPQEALEGDGDPFVRTLIDRLVERFGGVLAYGVRIELYDSAGKWGLPLDRVVRTLTRLSRQGLLHYAPLPALEEGGWVLLRETLPLDIDFTPVVRRAALERKKLRQMSRYPTTDRCRRAFILAYFGETLPPCGRCDVCRGSAKALRRPNPSVSQEGRSPESMGVEARTTIRKILSCVARLNRRFGKRRIAQVLHGSRSEPIRRYGLEELPTYGILSDFPIGYIESVIERLEEAGLLRAVSRVYPVLELTAEGREVMLERREVTIGIPEPPDRGRRRRPPAGSSPFSRSGDAALYARLSALRRSLAQARGIPPFRIFPDRTLREMAERRPCDRAALRQIHGVGEWKLAEYGEIFLAEIRREFTGVEPQGRTTSSAE